jgi:peptidoglycan/LPS O-acetylase OafA/YrhL
MRHQHVEQQLRQDNELEGIQILRAAAALLVVLSHALHESLAAKALPESPDWLTAFGDVGVDIFFVISGFIMFYVSFPASRAPVKPAHFLWKRLTRIYPFYWFCLLLTLAFWWLGLVPSVVPDADMLVRSVLLFPSNYFVIGVSWTLVYEMYFYLIFAASLSFARPLISLFGTTSAVLGLYALHRFAPGHALRTFLAILLRPSSALGCFWLIRCGDGRSLIRLPGYFGFRLLLFSSLRHWSRLPQAHIFRQTPHASFGVFQRC